MPKTKRFIDKNNAVTFNLVHRSQKDPLAADESAPQRVLVPVATKTDRKAADTQSVARGASGSSKPKEDLTKFGIFYDDDYDYSQHLRDVNPAAEWELAEDNRNSRTWKAPVVKGLSSAGPKLQLPSSVFQSYKEEKVGLLNRAAPHSGPRPDLDPDIIAALDDGLDLNDPDNILDDDFIQMADGVPSDDEESSEDEEDFGSEAEDKLGDLGSNSDFTLEDEPDFDDKQSRFTDYSMSSSVMRRSAGLATRDDAFEAKFNKEYGDEEIGALDCEEIAGHIAPDDELLLKLAAEFEEENMIGLKLNKEIGKKAREEMGSKLNDILEQVESDYEESSTSSSEGEAEKKWDCETILSKYSNTYNHPTMIKEVSKIKVDRFGNPLNVLGKGLTKKNLDNFNKIVEENDAKDDDDADERASRFSNMSSITRPKDETPAQRKERKNLTKDMRRARRLEKKANSLAFKEEKKLQERQLLNNRANMTKML